MSPIEVLEFVERNHVACPSHCSNQSGKFRERLRAGKLFRRSVEALQGIVDGGKDSGGSRIGDLNVENGVSPRTLDGLLNQRGLADPATAGHFGEKPTIPAQDLSRRPEFVSPAVKSPSHANSR